MSEKKGWKIFSEKNMKYWYAAALVIACLFALSMYNDAAVKSYQLIIYSPNGEIDRTETVMGAKISEKELDNLPVEKVFIPEKKIKGL